MTCTHTQARTSYISYCQCCTDCTCVAKGNSSVEVGTTQVTKCTAISSRFVTSPPDSVWFLGSFQTLYIVQLSQLFFRQKMSGVRVALRWTRGLQIKHNKRVHVRTFTCCNLASASRLPWWCGRKIALWPPCAAQSNSTRAL